MPPIISVVVNCFSRKDYVKEALKSVCDQTIPRSEYEVILIKNFHDMAIDYFAEEKGIISIYTDELTTGAWFEIAANVAKGNYVSFLDDDDLMHPNKLEIMNSLIILNPDIDYFHNKLERSESSFNYIGFDKSKVIYFKLDTARQLRKALKSKYYFNLSSVTVKRKILLDNMPYLRKTNHGTDFAIFFIASLSGKTMIEYGEPLTFYRIHTDSRANFKSKSRDEFEREKRKVLPNYLENWYIFSSMSNRSILKKYASVRLTTTKIWINLISPSHVYRVDISEIIQNIRGINLYPNFVIFIAINYLDCLFHNATKKIYYMILYSWLGWRLRENF